MFWFFSWSWKIFQHWEWSLQLSKKTKTVRMKEMFEFNSASKESSVVINVLGKFCSPDPTGFQTPACSMIKWSSAAILCRFFGINSYAVKVGFGTIIWSSSSSTILDVYRQTRRTRRISNNGMGSLPHHWFWCIWHPARLGLDGRLTVQYASYCMMNYRSIMLSLTHSNDNQHYRQL